MTRRRRLSLSGRKAPSHEGQLALRLRVTGEESWFACRGIFSAIYLRRHLARGPDMPSVGDVERAYQRILALWTENRTGLGNKNEAYLRTQFLSPILDLLGWSCIPEQNLPARYTTKKRPDYCLFGAPESQRRAASADTSEEVFREALTVLEAKQLGHPLDRVSARETPGWFPSQQVQDYLRHARDATGRRFFDWAILTNGKKWRLYCETAPFDAYFEFTLIDGEELCPPEAFRLFVALFRPAAYARDEEGGCLLDRLREESFNYQSELEGNLRRRVFDVLEDLANGYRGHGLNQITVADFQVLYESSLIFLYRLLFVLYAESRNILPVNTGPGANKRYREQFSIARLVSKLRDRQSSYSSDAFTDLYEELLKLFRLIDGGRREQNDACEVTRYNGGLFDSVTWPRIEKWRIGDATLANVLRQLIFAQPPARAGARQQQISTEETIDYSTLEVRQLGDIYEGLLGAHLDLDTDTGLLALRNEKGQNHRSGIFYTPDWIVRFLVQETLQPLLDGIEASLEVQAALRAKSDEKRRDNSFALGVARLNLVDPAMGSGHFLVRATEWLARKIIEHATTRRMTEQIVSHGERRRSREDILKDRRQPVSPSLSQQDAEIAYWRRRVVEACIYGVDTNPLAVELAKLSLWLTCIAADQPLNFLDHHLRCGNSLLGAAPEELALLPHEQKTSGEALQVGEGLTAALRSVIAENVDIEEEASTEMDVVKAKEARWKIAREKIAPFIKVANLWIAALDGLPLDQINYRTLALEAVAPDSLKSKERADAVKLRRSLAGALEEKTKALAPFHWQFEFPDVFFSPEGAPLPEPVRGFDAVLGNPPYISTHTSSAQAWRNALERRVGWLEDLYLHFTDLGFRILRPGGGFGFIVSDTFFTLASKQRMREWLQAHRLEILGQCDPFDATVDASIFVARKGEDPSVQTLFVQARPRRDAGGKTTEPEKFLGSLPSRDGIAWDGVTEVDGKTVRHAAHGPIRVHQVPSALWRGAQKQVFFEPRPATLRLFERFNEPVKKLVDEWWPRIETSVKFTAALPDLCAYHGGLSPGDVTLVGLVAEGGQGLASSNNARFLAWLEGTPKALEIAGRRQEWSQRWLASPKIETVFRELLSKNGGNVEKPTANGAAWEACVEPLRDRFTPAELGFGKTDLYRIAPKALLAGEEDFRFAWKERKAELLALWRKRGEFEPFWSSTLRLGGEEFDPAPLRKGLVSDENFCLLCPAIVRWFHAENEARRERKEDLLKREALGLRSSEFYDDPTDAPRIAAIYNGFSGRGIFVPFRKGDPEGNRWMDNEPLFIDWSAPSVDFLSQSPKSRWQGCEYFLAPGISWTRGANHVAIKAKIMGNGVFDVNAMKLRPVSEKVIRSEVLLALFNSDVFSFFLKRFLAHTWMAQISDLRMMPLVIPTPAQERRLRELAERAMEAKQLSFEDAPPSPELAAAVREVGEGLLAKAPAYLHPPAQLRLLTTAADALSILELAVNWEAEKLYGVEGLGPFDEF